MMSAVGAQAHKLIVIVGFMGAGKTTVARELARLRNCSAIDLDELITERGRRSPSEIIEQSGEVEFRRIETETLRQVLNERSAGPDKLVIALGGGAWVLQTNRDLIKAHHGFSIWLDAPFELCWERIQISGEGRPLARDQREARSLYDERRAQYALAELQLPISRDKNPREICGEIALALQVQT